MAYFSRLLISSLFGTSIRLFPSFDITMAHIAEFAGLLACEPSDYGWVYSDHRVPYTLSVCTDDGDMITAEMPFRFVNDHFEIMYVRINSVHHGVIMWYSDDTYDLLRPQRALALNEHVLLDWVHMFIDHMRKEHSPEFPVVCKVKDNAFYPIM